MRLKFFTVLAMLCVFAVNVKAHDYWLEADNFFPAPNSEVTVKMWLGGWLAVEEERPFQPKRTPFLQLFAANGATDLLKTGDEEDKMPFAKFKVGAAGNYLLAQERTPSFLTLEADKFHDYLREEGLEKIIAEREKRGETQEFGRERYSRYIKTLLQVGGKNDAIFGKNVGLKFEIVPLDNPYKKKIGEQIRFRVLFNGKQLEGVELAALNRYNNQVFQQKMRTDAKGEAVFKLDRNGFWLVRGVEMRRCEKDCNEIDWESFWAAFSFGIK
jgi:uncharacterized GH25 family protein